MDLSGTELSKAAVDSGPYARRSAGGAVHNGCFYTFGGFGSNGSVSPDDVNAELWRFDNGWELIEADGPAPARFPSLCSMGGGIYRFGGCGYDRGLTFVSSIWRYENSWSLLEPKSEDVPLPRYASALVWDGEEFLVFGGYSEKAGREKVFLGDLWRFDLGRQVWRLQHGCNVGPGPRYGFGWTANKTHLFIFGGFDGHADRNDLWQYSFIDQEWVELSSSGPAARYCPALSCNAKGRLVLFGGRSKTSSRVNYSDTWLYDGAWRQQFYSDGPGYHAKSAVAGDENKLWIFAGEGPQGHVSDLWCHSEGRWEKMHPARNDDPILW